MEKRKSLVFFLIISLFFLFLAIETLASNGSPPNVPTPYPLTYLNDTVFDIACRIKKQIVPYVGGFAIVVAGILFMFSGASPEFHNMAKNALIYIVVGLLIIWGASEIILAITGVDRTCSFFKFFFV